MGNLSGESKAPTLVLALQLTRSASHSVSVGKRYPLGQGLFTPFTPCQRLTFAVLRQSPLEVIKSPFPGVSLLLNEAVVPDVLLW
jgi:hypothetical protein